MTGSTHRTGVVRCARGGTVGIGVSVSVSSAEESRSDGVFSDNSSLPLICALRIRFSEARYSFLNNNSWSTVPVM